MKRIPVLLTALLWNIGSYAADTDQLEALNQLAPYFDGQKSPDSLEISPRDSCPVKIAKLAALYAHQPNQHRNEFFAMLVIDDYADRDKGIYNFVGSDQVGEVIGEHLGSFGSPTDKRFEPVIAYCGVRDKNLWVITEKRGRISIARLMRGAFLGLLLKNTSEDPLGIANAVDQRTAKQYERTK